VAVKIANDAKTQKNRNDTIDLIKVFGKRTVKS